MIIYNDPRRFGYFKILNNGKELKNYFKNYGPEAISMNFNFKYIKYKLLDKNKNIKNFLLDQNFVSGIIYYLDNAGNVYNPADIFQNKENPKIIAKYRCLETGDTKKYELI